MDHTTFVGLDVHAETIEVAVAKEGRGPATALGEIANTPEAVTKLVRKLGDPRKLLVCYEAGPCGYGLYRQLMALGVACVVVAPSLVPVRPGERVKTDRRDAAKLATLLRSGQLTAVYVPDEREEALRDLVRGREDAKQDETRARHRLRKFLLRQGRRPPAGVRPWTAKYRKWLDSLHFERPEHERLFAEYLQALDEAADRVQRLTRAIEEALESHPLRPLVDALQALKGVQLVTAATMAVEAGDFLRFGHPRQTMSYGGLVPSERSSGGTIRRGPITKAGNAHLRRVVVEAAWSYRYPPRRSAALRRRQAHLPPKVKAIAWKAQMRLHARFRRLVGRGKPKNVAVVAVARELLAFAWAIAQEVLTEKPAAQQAG